MQCRNCNSLDLFAQYVFEREGALLLKLQDGFAIYKDINSDYGYLQDMYVVPEKRRTGVGTQLLQKVMEIAKNANKKALLTSTDTATNNADESVKTILNNGFRILKLEGTVIWYSLEIH